MRLAARRFPDSIIRRREEPGYRDKNGEWVPGATVETTLRASVQPLKLEDADTVAGVRVQDRRKAYIPVPDALRAAADDATGDVVIYQGLEYAVTLSESWPNHTRAMLLRET